MKILLKTVTILLLLSPLYSGFCFSKSNFQHDAILKIQIVKRSGSSVKIYSSGNGFLISKEGQFLTSYKLIKLALKSPFTYRMKVINNLGDELFNIKIAGCGHENNIDLCLLKANYTIKKPFNLELNNLVKKEEISSTSLLKNNSISSNQGSFLDYQPFKAVEHIKSTIPYTKQFLGSPILNEKKNVVAMISYTYGSSTFDAINLYLSANSILKFIKGKQDFISISPKKGRWKNINKKRKGKGAKDLSTFIKNKSKELEKLLKSIQGSQNNQSKEFLLKKKKLELAEGKVGKVKELMKEKETIKQKKEESFKDLISLQSSLQEIEAEERKITDSTNKIDKEISRLENLNREMTLKKIKNKKQIKKLSSESDKKVFINLNNLLSENIQLTDDKIKKLKQKNHLHKKSLVSKLNQIKDRKKHISEKIGKKNLLIEGFESSIEGLDAQAFDYFDDAI